ncbi:MAG: asparagine synthase (glutamine-hydrolyzing) [bacterium]
MCGICGIYSRKRNVDHEILIRMRDTMIHRGPDGAGIYISKNRSVGFGHRRLKVIDLSDNATQPMTNEDRTIWLVCNGEIYNFLELRNNIERKGHKFKSRNDNEVILHLYEEKGIDLIDDLDGDFTFAIWDEHQQVLYVVRDRLGIKPCFYYYDSDNFIFASEIKAILQFPSFKRSLNPVALHHFLTYHTIPAPYTIYKGINKLLPGHYLQIDDTGSFMKKYWSIEKYFVKSSVIRGESDYVAEFLHLYKNAIKKRLMSDVPLGIYLSGGVDSSSLVALASELTKSLKTFSVTFGEEFSCDESIYSNEVAKRYMTEHHDFKITPDVFNRLPEIVKYFDEPFAIPSAVPMYELSKHASHQIKVVLTGDGGDEFYGGYARYHWDIVSEKIRCSGLSWLTNILSFIFRKIPADLVPHKVGKGRDYLHRLLSAVNLPSDERYVRYLSFLSEKTKRSLYTDEFAAQLGNVDSVSILRDYYDYFCPETTLKKRIYGDIMTTLPDEMLTKGDRMTMSSSLENRVPLLDFDLVKFAARLPDEYKIQKGVGKYLMKKAMLTRLPRHLLFRRKMGFNVPLGIWLRGNRHWLLDKYLNEEEVSQANVFNPSSVLGMVDRFINGKENIEYHIYPLLVFHIWYSECFKN